MKIAIQGHLTRGKEVIQILESLGGKNSILLEGSNQYVYYGIYENEIMVLSNVAECKRYTLEEFEKEFPFKIGDKVISITTGFIGIITELKENGCYYFKYDNGNIACAFGQYLKLYKEMERNITLTLEKAKEWYNKGGELKEIALQAFTEKELNPLPKSWEEFCKNYRIDDSEAYFDTCGMIYSADITYRDSIYDKNICPSKKSAEAHLAMIQLEQLRNCWLNGWEPIWDCSEKWCIRLWGNELGVGVATHISRFLTFPTNEMAREFLECFRDLIEKARDLI